MNTVITVPRALEASLTGRLDVTHAGRPVELRFQENATV